MDLWVFAWKTNTAYSANMIMSTHTHTPRKSENDNTLADFSRIGPRTSSPTTNKNRTSYQDMQGLESGI